MTPEVIISLVSSAVLAIFASITAPMILAWRTQVMAREDREADWARQDKVAAEARAAAENVAAQLLSAEEHASAAEEKTHEKLDVIHVLVNSNMDAAMQGELDAVRRELAMTREVAALTRAAGREPAVRLLGAIEAAGLRIAALEAQLAERKKAAREAARLRTPPQDPA